MLVHDPIIYVLYELTYQKRKAKKKKEKLEGDLTCSGKTPCGRNGKSLSHSW